MKNYLTEWMMNLTLFSLLSSTVTKLLPGKTYLPYIRIFTGIMMILIFLQPVLQVTGMEEEIRIRFEENLYEAKLRQMEQELMQIEEKQRIEFERQYQEYMGEQENGREQTD